MNDNTCLIIKYIGVLFYFLLPFLVFKRLVPAAYRLQEIASRNLSSTIAKGRVSTDAELGGEELSGAQIDQ